MLTAGYLKIAGPRRGPMLYPRTTLLPTDLGEVLLHWATPTLPQTITTKQILAGWFGLLNQRALAFGVRAMEFVELGRQQREQLFDRQGMQIPCQIKLAQDICKAARAAGAFGAQSGAIASLGSVIIETCGNSHDGVAGDERWSRSNQPHKCSGLSWRAAQQ